MSVTKAINKQTKLNLVKQKFGLDDFYACNQETDQAYSIISAAHMRHL